MPISAPTTVATFTSAANATTTGAQALSGTVPVGATMIVHVGIGNSSDTVNTPTDTQGNTYTLAGSVVQSTGAQTATAVYTSQITHALTAGTDTVTATWGATATGAAVTWEYVTGSSGLDGAAVTQAVSTGSTTVTFPAITVNTGDLLLIKSDTGSAVTTLSAFSPAGVAQDYLRTTTGTNLRTSFGLVGTGLTAGSVTASVHTNSGQVYTAVLLALAPTGGGPAANIKIGGAVQL